MFGLQNLRLSRKFATAFGTLCLLCLLQGVGALVGLFRIDHLTRDLTERSLVAATAMTEMRGQMQTIRRVELASLLCHDAVCERRYPPMRSAALDKYQAARQRFETVVTDPAELGSFHALVNEFGIYLDKSAVIVNGFTAAGEHDQGSLAAQEQGLLGDFNHSLTDAVALTTLYNNRCLDDGARVDRSNQVLRWLGGSITLAVTLLSIAIGLVLTRLIAPPLVAAAAALEEVARKNLTVSVEARSSDEVGRLSHALNKTVAAMREVLRAVGRTADTLSGAAEELSVQSTQTSANTELQTSQTQQIAAAAEEMSATIAEISRNAEAASVASRKAAETASEGGAVMQAAASTMEKIASASGTVAQQMDSLAQRSTAIGNVVSVIQEISEQTNLLALNAAIEAARAGEHGRGFAVVAGEVRRLAERTKSATEEIAGTIRTIQQETGSTLTVMRQSREAVESGRAETAKARERLEAIIVASREVEQMIHMIASAATEQTAASGEISRSAGQISQLAGANSQAAGEAAQACQHLSSMASDLDGMIRQFTLNDESGKGGAGQSMDFDRCIAVHVRWKSKLASYLKHPDRSLDAATTAQDSGCDLGKWLYGEGRRHAQSPEFSHLVAEHARFHRAAGDVIRRADSGQKVAEDVALGGHSEFAQASTSVVGSLMQARTLFAG
ncbi:MAG TPA: methyl-accepting chemotaxis protein [Acidobacteriaceae bacterium]|jgi:methyl-accepting chemotaxis protein|nr:methyl-accepting chemotaxis protein [Acidobacteriaceae bacterium]